MFPIQPVPKTYSWGSDHRLQDIFGIECPGPLAEMWFSGHPASPSPVDMDGDRMALDEAIRRAPELMVGTDASETWGPVLPYLFKIISARIPLSLQVHPVDFEARAGYNRENAAGIPVDSPIRSFKDSIAKHEMVVALERFEASVGFAPRPIELAALHAIDHPLAQAMARELAGKQPVDEHGLKTRYSDAPATAVARVGDFSYATDRINASASSDDVALAASVGSDGIDADMPAAAKVWGHTQRRIFRAFRMAVTAPREAAQGLGEALESACRTCKGRRSSKIVQHAAMAARAFPGDPSVLCVAMLNPVSLERGESVFIPAGTPHCYLQGTGAEIMTNSDNVLRAGMTPKHKDIPNLLRNLDCNPAPPIDPTSRTLHALFTPNLAVYRPKLSEFMLSYGHVGTDDDSGRWDKMAQRQRSTITDYAQSIAPSAAIPAVAGPRVLVCIEGEVQCTSSTQSVVVHKGEASFIPASDGRAQVTSVNGKHGVYLLASTGL